MKALFLMLIFTWVTCSFAGSGSLKTLGELSHWKETGHYVEVERLCQAFASKFPDHCHCVTFGVTPEGRKMRALILADSRRALIPSWNQKNKRPVIYFQGGIHAGEIDGKDAGFWLVRELLEKEASPKLQEALKSVTLVFVPVFNVDGHERFGKNNRPNQVGPEEMGWRTTAQNYNLNRDYVKADSPEMQALLKFIEKWDPVVGLDLHVTDGAQFQHDVSIVMEPVYRGPTELRDKTIALRETILSGLKSKGHLPLGFYPNFKKEEDPASGFAQYVSPPRFSQGYLGLRNRIGILVETHSWKNYANRVKATRDVLDLVIESAAVNGRDWRKTTDLADALFSNAVGQKIGLSYEATDKSKEIEFLGYKYQRAKSEVSGAIEVTYFPNQPEVWKVPFFEEVVPQSVAQVPEGYLIPKAFAPIVIPKLQVHSLKYRELSENVGLTEVETFRADTFNFSPKSFEGHQRLTVSGDWKKEKVTLYPGDLFVSCRQPKWELVVQLMEPTAPDSLLAWGFFNTRFETKEYMENYVAEAFAQELLLNPEIKKAFQEKLKEPEFEDSPTQRLEFFHRRHPSWDKVLGLVPVYRASKQLR
jgi:Zinc carboxypeptidase